MKTESGKMPQKISDELTEHIEQLVLLGKELSAISTTEKIEKKWLEYAKNESWPASLFFRGADICVIKVGRGEDKTKWRVTTGGYTPDEPCPTQYPELLSGLLLRVQEGATYLDYMTKYAFYGAIAERAQQIQLSERVFDKQELCKDIVFHLIRFLNMWRNEAYEEEQNAEPSLIEKGWVIYFGFGRNVSRADMLSSRRCPDAIYLGPATLDNHRFLIDKKGFASIERSPGSSVRGVLWAVSPTDLRRLDLREGIKIGSYRKETVKANPMFEFFFGLKENETVEALAYISNRPEGNIPAEGYIETIIDGLLAAGFSENDISYCYSYLEKGVSGFEKIEKSETSHIKNFPSDTSLPMFAYGLFKSTQVGHTRIRRFVEKTEAQFIEGAFLMERNGVPLLGFKSQIENQAEVDHISCGGVNGEIIEFKRGKGQQAYKAISEIEPKSEYRWAEIEIGKKKANVLVGKSIFKGSHPIENTDWDMKVDDPFVEGIERVYQRLLSDRERAEDIIELQSVYMMVWSGIERLCTLRNSLKKMSDGELVHCLSKEKGVAALFSNITEQPYYFRSLSSASDFKDNTKFVPNNTMACLKYLRQVRNNVVHRGKASFIDIQLTGH